MPLVGAETEALRSFKANMEQAFLLAATVRRGGCMTLLNPWTFAYAIAKHDTTRQSALVTLARETVPTILLTHLITVHEAYWEALALAIYQAHPHLLPVAETAMRQFAPRYNPPQAPATTDDRVGSLFRKRRYTYLAVAVWEQGLNLPFSAICRGARTTPQGLDRAKAVRNVHIHNQGLADADFIQRTGDPTINVGDPIPVTIEYATETMRKLYAVLLDLDAAAINAYPQIV